MGKRLIHLWNVVKHGATFAGWFAGIVTVIFGGSVLGGTVWLLKADHRTYATVLFFLGLLVIVVEGSYRVLAEMTEILNGYKARLVDLDTVEAKLAYVDEAIADALAFREAVQETVDVPGVEGVGEWPAEWFDENQHICDDIHHWETELRVAFRKNGFPHDSGRLLDSDARGKTDHPAGLSRDAYLDYMARRLERLQEIRASIT
jgi:hypothetical protein